MQGDGRPLLRRIPLTEAKRPRRPRRLADELGIAEQQMQRYESTEYRSASLARICDIAATLGIDIAETAQLRDPDAA